MHDLRTKLKAMGLGTALLLGAGCMITGKPPADLAQVVVTTVDSPAVMLADVRLVRRSGDLYVIGRVFKRRGPEDTASTHLDVTWFDAAGHSLNTSTGGFTPRNLVRRGPRPAVGTFHIRLAIPPTIPHRIEVRAHPVPCPHYSGQPNPSDAVDSPHELPSASRNP